MKSNIVSFAAGLVFSIGLCLSGMTQPSKVVGFLDFIGNWDPSLMLVMAGAVTIYYIAQRLTLHLRDEPVFGKKFELPTRVDIDWQLIAGAVLFGAGWGLVGFCPGPAIVSVVSGNSQVLVFVVAMAAGMYLFGAMHTRFEREPDGGAGVFEHATMVELEREDKIHHLP